MNSGLVRWTAIFLLALSLGILSGAVNSVLAAMAQHSHAAACCPAERPEGQQGEGQCVSPECQCPACLTFDLPRHSLSVAGNAEAIPVYHDDESSPASGDRQPIDYPPEAA